ncbi:TetR/AcrR family transcriptional regulator [Acetobacter oeni]|uniref:TetR family transcriptional regulator n=2 Tax=Acetobacter oeni TaxID=304077 RepID=A0A511XGS0_9PROT|nr:TetR/AcrR family transcriptional regulator [Acetobacter oeni]MBB3881710.1 AcrR family transcriptional regulator [Acetobacter oeni]NHO17485.1 TetR family transcriptional regulator [Acetobacter oeni]GBR05948.1 transcriptional regulator [Acetobacter oeni LMG 21952]GEN62119.1 TetR family transcriptional regulator [Acetobacter oeni]
MEECERRERIMTAACKILQAHGYHAASMDKVAQCSGMSKRTLYQLYPSKQDLFLSLIGSRLFCTPSFSEKSSTPEGGLTSLLLGMTKWLLSPDKIELIRAIIAETPEAKDISDIMLNLKKGGDSNAFNRWLRHYCIESGHPDEDITLLGRHLFGMTIGELMLNALTGTGEDMAPEMIERFVASGARLFLAGLAAEWERHAANGGSGQA